MNPEPLEWWRWVLLVFFFGGLLGTLYWVKRGPGRFDAILRKSTHRIHVHETKWLGTRTSVSLLEVDGERFLLAQQPGSLAWSRVDNVGCSKDSVFKGKESSTLEGK